MKKRAQIEAELAQLALDVASKSHEEAAAAILELYKGMALLHAEEQIQDQLKSAQSSMQEQLKARIEALQNDVEVPVAEKKISVPKPQPEPVETPVATSNELEEDANQLSLVDVAEEIEAEASKSLASTSKPGDEKKVYQLTEDDQEVKKESVAEKAQQEDKKSLNDRLAGGALKFGLNDRIGFVKDLFDGSAEDFNRVVSQLNTLGSLGEAQDFLTTHIAPEYGWADNEETAERFMAAVEQRFG